MTPFLRRAFNLSAPRRSWRKHIAVLHSYCDESGIHEGARYCEVAGYVGSLRQWNKFCVKWEPYAQKPGFHAKEFFKRNQLGQRVKPYEGWSDKKADDYLNSLLQAIGSVNVYPVGGIVDIQEFRRYSKDERAQLTGRNTLRGKDKINGAPTKPYFLAFQEAIAGALEKLNRSDWKVHFTFDQQHTFAPLATQMYGIFTTLEHRFAHRMGDLTFASRFESIPLQASDLLSHSWYRFIRDGERTDPIFRFIIGKQKVRSMTFFDRATMDRLLKKNPLP